MEVYIRAYIEQLDRPVVAAGSVVVVMVPQRAAVFQSRAELEARLPVRGSGVLVVRAVTGMRGVGKT
jgi:hypothetical protein